MAYKDEYEVARLYGNGEFLRQVAEEFDGERLRFEFHLAPPLLARRDRRTGVPRKITFGPWMLSVFRLLMRFKFLRGTAFDPFGYGAERRMERKLIADYEATLAELLAQAQSRQPSPGGRHRGDPGEDPRLRPRQAAAPRGRQGRRGDAARPAALRRAALSQGGGVAGCFDRRAQSLYCAARRGRGHCALW